MSTIITGGNGDSGGGTLGAIVLGAFGVGVGILVIDHHFSAPGHSTWDKLKGRLMKPKPATKVGAAALDSGETGKLPDYAKQVLQHALDSETDQSVLTQLAANLSAAGMPNTAAAVHAKMGTTAASGYYAGASMVEHGRAGFGYRGATQPGLAYRGRLG
jgi:hypothetical protein